MSDISPRAKVTCDQDNFIVEFSVQDYSPEVGTISMFMIINCSRDKTIHQRWEWYCQTPDLDQDFKSRSGLFFVSKNIEDLAL